MQQQQSISLPTNWLLILKAYCELLRWSWGRSNNGLIFSSIECPRTLRASDSRCTCITVFFCSTIPPNLRSVVYCHAMSQGGAAEWEWAFSKYAVENVAVEKVKLLSSLGCTTEVYLLERSGSDRIFSCPAKPEACWSEDNCKELIFETLAHCAPNWNQDSHCGKLNALTGEPS